MSFFVDVWGRNARYNEQCKMGLTLQGTLVAMMYMRFDENQ